MRGIVLVVVLEAERVLAGRVVVEVGHGHVRREAACAGNERVVDVRCGRRSAVERRRWGSATCPARREARAN